jgi:hypothetical protein
MEDERTKQAGLFSQARPLRQSSSSIPLCTNYHESLYRLLAYIASSRAREKARNDITESLDAGIKYRQHEALYFLLYLSWLVLFTACFSRIL